MYVWEAADGRIAAALNPESAGQAFLRVDPAFRTVALVAGQFPEANALYDAVQAYVRGGRREEPVS